MGFPLFIEVQLGDNQGNFRPILKVIKCDERMERLARGHY